MKITYLFVGIIVGFIASYLLTYNTCNNHQIAMYSVDTLLIHDTVKIVSPDNISETKVESRRFKVKPESISDTIENGNDTITVIMDVVSRRYSGELYDAYVSGVEPTLDSIHIYTPHSIITRTQPSRYKRWHFGVSAGAAATLRGFQPYIGIGVTYSLFAF